MQRQLFLSIIIEASCWEYIHLSEESKEPAESSPPVESSAKTNENNTENVPYEPTAPRGNSKGEECQWRQLHPAQLVILQPKDENRIQGEDVRNRGLCRKVKTRYSGGLYRLKLRVFKPLDKCLLIDIL